MNQRFEAELRVNDSPVELNRFIEQFIARTVAGAKSSLRDAENMETIEFHLKQGDVTIIVNGNELDITAFPNQIMANTITAMVSSLKGVDRVENLHIMVKVSPV